MPGHPEAAGPDPSGPQSAAMAWVEAVMDLADLGRAWPLTDPTLRLVLVQDWIWAHRRDPVVAVDDPDGLASLLARNPPEHFLWDRFARDQIGEWHAVWRGFGSRTWRAREGPEVVDLDLEMVTLVEAGPTPGAAAPPLVRRFLLRHTDAGWLVGGLSGHRVFRPGWPPSPEIVGSPGAR